MRLVSLVQLLVVLLLTCTGVLVVVADALAQQPDNKHDVTIPPHLRSHSRLSPSVGDVAGDDDDATVGTCPSQLYEMDTLRGVAYMSAIGAAVDPIFTIAPSTGRLTISLWTRLSVQQVNSVSMLLQVGSIVHVSPNSNETRFGDSLSVFWSSDDAAVGAVLVNNATTTGIMPVQTSIIDDGSMPLNDDRYHNVIVILDAVMGYVVISVDSVPTAVMQVASLKDNGFLLNGAHSGLSIGADFQGQSNAVGSFADLTIVPDMIGVEDAKYMTLYRMPMEVRKEVNATPVCVVSPCSLDTTYPFHGVNVSTFFFTPSGGNTFPNATIMSPYNHFGFYPIYTSPFSLRQQLFAVVNITRPSWTPTQLANSQCGAKQSGYIAFPDPTVAYNVKFWLSANATPPIGSTLNITTADGLFLASFTMTEVPTSPPKIEFVYQNYALAFNISATISDFCISFSAVSERPGVIATPHTVFSTESSTLNLVAGVGPMDKVAFSSDFNCYNVPASQILTPMPFVKFDVIAYYTVNIPEMTTLGLNVLCVYPNSTLPPSGQAYAATRCPKTDNTDTFLCGLSVAQLPSGAIPLTQDWLTDMLHLGASYTDAIWHGIFEADYFQTVGGERKILPQAGDVLDMTSERLVWTPMTRPDGLWGTMNENTSLSLTEPEWVQYMSLGVYAGQDMVTAISVRAWSAAKIFVDGTNVFQLSPASYGNNSAAATTVYRSSTFTLRKGWHQVMVKLWRAPSVYTSIFSMRFDQVSGLSWLFTVPSNSSSNTSYANTCVNANRTVPCIPSATNLNISHSECVAMGCCFDPSNTGNVCFSSSAPAVPYRTDGHCGLGWPSAIGNVSLCNTDSSTGSSCCSAHEWCGSSFAHCNCATCTNARYASKGHCNYVPWGSQARCLGSRTVPMGAMSQADCQMECDMTTGCIAFQTAIVSFSMTCTLVFSTTGSCTATIMDTTVTRLFLRSCLLCNFDRNNTFGNVCVYPGAVNTYGIAAPNPQAFVTYSQCQYQCTMAVACVGIQYNNATGLCQFLNRACPQASLRPANDTVMSMYTCAGDQQVAPVPLPQVPNTTSIAALGCYPDYGATFLSASTFGSFDATNQYKANYMPSITNLTIEKCTAYCMNLGAVYFALSKGSVCTCGVRLPESLPTPSEAMCTTRCPGNMSEVCGGAFAASVFRINYQPGSCPSGFSYFMGNCYQYFGQSGGSDMKSWHDARDACNDLGASLASVHSAAENQFVLSFTYFFNETNTRIAWVGGYQYPADSSYQWEDGTAWDFADWRYNEPNAKNYAESCVTAFSNYPTPYKGSFNDDSCVKLYPYICKMPAQGSSVYPSVYATVVDGTINCAPAAAMAQFNNDLAAWYQFDRVSNYSTNVVLDQSAHRRDISFNTTVQSSSSSTPTTVGATPSFVPGVVQMAVVLNGSSFFTPVAGAQSDGWDIRGNEVSVSVWMLQQDANNNANQIIVSKSFGADATDMTNPQFEWALAFQDGALCFIIGPYRACGVSPALNTWTHVIGTFDGTLIHLVMNGTLISSFDTVLNSNVTFYFPKNPNTTVVVGYRSATPLDTSRMFRGLLDDLRIFRVAINVVQGAYLLYCTPDAAPQNTIYVYDSTPSAFVLAGEGLGDGQSFALSTTSCAAGTPAYMTANEQTFAFDSMFASLPVPGIPPLPLNTTTMMVPTYFICHVNQLDRSVIYGDTFFRMAVTAINTVNGFVQQVTVNNTQFPLMLELGGVQLRAGQVLVTAMDSDCSLIDGVYPITNVNNMSTQAYVTINKPALISDTIHLCWGSSPLALGETSAQSPIGIATGDNLKDIGITILMVDPSGMQFKAIAAIDGTTPITPQTISNGMSNSYTNYFLQCSDANYFGDNYVAIVTMGEYVDYLIPQKGVSVCNLLGANPWSVTHSYTSNNPLGGSAYPADAAIVPPLYTWSFLGGSPYGFPKDGREYLSTWGTQYGGGTDIGGFGQATPLQVPEWYQPYSIVIWSVPNTTYYLSLSLAPTVFTPGAFLAIEAQLLDNHNALVTTPTTFRLDFPTSSHIITSNNGLMQFNRTMHMNDTQWTGISFSVNITAIVGPGMTVANGPTRSFEATMGPALPAGLEPINPALGLTSYLHFGALNQSIPVPYFYVGMYDDWFGTYGGEANMRPAENQTNTAISNYFVAGDNINRTYTWQVVTDPTGYWRDSAAPDSLQFFAGAFYSPMEQNMRLQYSCDDGMVVYIDGIIVAQEFQPSNNSRTETIMVGPGYHQLFIKLVNQFSLSLLEIKLEGSGLGWAPSIPVDIPEGAQLLSNGVPLMEALQLGPQVYVGTFGEDFINESTIRPVLGVEVSPGQSWMDSLAVNGNWTVNASYITGRQSMAVSYLALGLYAPVDMSLVFVMQVPTALSIWYDGANVIRVDGSQMPTYSDNVYISAGWHQVLIKIGAGAGTVQKFSITPTDMTGVLAWSLSPQYALPIGVRAIKNGAPLTSLMVLQTNASIPMPFPSPPSSIAPPSSDTMQAVSFIPFGPGTLNSNLTYPDFPLKQFPQLEPYDSVPIAAVPKAYFEWTPATLSPQGPAYWGQSGMGGMFNSYYAITLYASAAMSGVSMIVDSIGANFALWMDDQLVTSNTISGSASGTSTTVLVDIPQGFHQILLKQQVPSDFSLINTGGSRMTWNDANTICHQNHHRQVCSLEAYCPYGAPRKGVVPTQNGSFFMPYRDITNGWVQTGTGGNNTNMCETWMQTHANTAPWGQDGTTSLPIRGSVGCCGSFARPAISIAVDASAASSSAPNAALGWMYGFPQVDVQMPTIGSTNPRARTQTISIHSSTPNAVIYYTTDFSTPTTSSRRYNGPFNVTQTTFISAIAYVNSLSSSMVAFYQVRILPHPTIERTQCVAGAACFVPAVSVDPGWYFAFMPTSWNASMLSMVLRSAANAASLPVTNSFSGLITVQSDNGVLVPGLVQGAYYAVSYDMSGAGTIASTLVFSSVIVSPSQVVGTASTLFNFTGGVQTGDGVLFLNPLYPSGETPACSAQNCARGFSDNPSKVLTVANSFNDFVTTVDLSTFSGTITCLCVCATGAFGPPGVVIPRNFILVEEISSAVPTYIRVQAPSPDGDKVTAVFPSAVADDGVLTLVGNFTNASTVAFTVSLIPASAQPSVIVLPTCSVTFANASVILCSVNVRDGTSGLWYVHLFYRGDLVANAAIFTITAVPPTPTITGASGACVDESKNCVTSSVLFFYGTDFNTVTPSYNDVLIGSSPTTASCTVINVTSTYVACSLMVSSSAPSGTYPVSLMLYVSPTTSITVSSGSAILLGQGTKPGWNGGTAPSHTPSPSYGPTGGAPAPADDKTAIIAGSLSAVVFALILALAVIRYRYSLVPKAVQQSKEMDYIEEQLMESGAATTSPRGRQSSLEPEPIREQGQSRYTAPDNKGSINNM